MLFSHSWRFCFDVPGDDELAYITPVWIENETIFEPISDQLLSYPKDTHLYLPLKLATNSDTAEQYLDKVVTAVDPCILLNMKKLQTFTIHDKRKMETIIIKKEIRSEITFDRSDRIVFESFTFHEVSGSIVELQQSSNVKQFRVYVCYAEISSAVEQKRNSRTELRLAFPCNKDFIFNANVYAGLPVCNLGFNFMFSADFQLVTNRENLQEDVTFNCDLRDHLAAFFVYLLLNDDELKKDFDRYCPSNSTHHINHSSWWKVMVNQIYDLIRRNSKLLFGITSGIYSMIFCYDFVIFSYIFRKVATLPKSGFGIFRIQGRSLQFCEYSSDRIKKRSLYKRKFKMHRH